MYWKAFTGDIVPQNREGATLCCADGCMYLFGGLGSILLNDLFVLDLSARQWRQIRPAKRLLWPDQRYGHSATVIEQNFFIFGGQQRFNELKKLRTCFNDLWCFDTVKERFVAQYVNGFTMARAFHVAVPVHRSIFIHGGLDKHSHLIQDASYFSLDLKSWIDLPISNPEEGPEALAHHAAVGIFDKGMQGLKIPKNGVIYIFGGKSNQGLSDKLYALQFDLKLPRWRLIYLVGSGPTPRMGHSLSFLPHLNKLLILGGRYKSEENDDLWAVSLKTLQWQQLGSSGDVPLPRCGHSAAVYEDQLLVMGGLSRAIFPRNDLFVLYSARYFCKSGADQKQEYKKAYFHATGELFAPLHISRALARFKPKRLLRIQKALESLEEKKLLKAIKAASST